MSQQTVRTSDVSQIWYTRCPVPTASSIALSLGWLEAEFAAYGIKINSLRDSDTDAMRNAHFHHELVGLFREGGNIPPIWAKAQGRDTVVVALTWVDEYQAIFVRSDSDIRELSDLRGRTIGLPRQIGGRVDFARAMALRGIVSALILGGLTEADIMFEDITSEQTVISNTTVHGRFHQPELDALQSGGVDAIYAKGAWAAGIASESGVRTLVNIGEHPDPLVRVNNGNPRPVTVDRATAEERPDLVARYLATLVRASQWARTHEAEVVDIVAREVGRTAEDVRVGYGPKLNRSFDLDLSPHAVAGLPSRRTFFSRMVSWPTTSMSRHGLIRDRLNSR
jgi:sulfonate transport system substrate-binding protein